MRSIRLLATVSLFSIIGLASCAGGAPLGSVTPQTLRELERCSAGALFIVNTHGDDFRIVSSHNINRSRPIEVRGGSNQVVCVNESDLNRSANIDLVLLRLVLIPGNPRPAYETLDREVISMDRNRLHKVSIEGSRANPLMRVLPMNEEELYPPKP